MKPTIRIILVLISLVSLYGTACRKVTAASSAPASETLLNYLQNNYAFSLFYYGVHKTGLDRQLLNGKDPYTLLIPDNDAFARDSIFTTGDLDKMDTANLRKWMSYHILSGSIKVADIPQAVNNPYPNMLGVTLWFSRPIPGVGQSQKDFDHILYIDGGAVNTSDITASDGVIQVLNQPLQLPDTSIQTYLAAHAQYSEFVSCLQRFGLWDQLAGPGPITVFAPENTSFIGIRVSPDSLSRLDTVRFKTSLFGIYIVNPGRIFMTDFYDIGFYSPGNIYAGYITPNGTYYFSNGALTGSGIDPVSTQPVPAAYLTTADIVTLNGVVHGMHGVLLTPGQAIK
jgi:uncharacterized surface protein with fasciclin (FAS1) repeats